MERHKPPPALEERIEMAENSKAEHSDKVDIGNVLQELLVAFKCTQAATALGTEKTHLLPEGVVWHDVQPLLKELEDLTRIRTDPNKGLEKRSPENLTNGKRRRIEYNPDVVQINVPYSEIQRRMGAFIKRKRIENDESNVAEFTRPRLGDDAGFSARTHPTDIHRLSKRSHLKVSVVENQVGPMDAPLAAATTFDGVAERLDNMEACLGLEARGTTSVPANVYQRLKQLEDRMLLLEGLSPELFRAAVVHTNKNEIQQEGEKTLPNQGPPIEMPTGGESATLEDIDRRIAELQGILQMRSSQ